MATVRFSELLYKVQRMIMIICVQSVKKKKMNTHINSNTNYCRETKLIPINMDHCLPKFNALKFLLGVRFLGGCLPNFIFFDVNHQSRLQNCKIHSSNWLNTNFHSISNISLRVIRCRNYS